jgi:cellulose biosynthesis protein BcsQ
LSLVYAWSLQLKSIVFFNNKGGVGKTTLICNVVSYMNMHMNKRVLLIDADPQCNATQAILPEQDCISIYLEQSSAFKTLYDYLEPIEVGDSSIKEGSVKPILGSSNKFKTDIIPGHPRMSIIEDLLSRSWNESLSGDIGGIRITNWCNQVLEELSSRYDAIFFDVGPSLGALNRTVLLSCDYIVTPFGCDIFSLLGIRNISEWIRNWNSLYLRSLELTKEHGTAKHINRFSIVKNTTTKFRLAGYSVQQYITRKFKDGPRPVRAYDNIMQQIPETVSNSLNFLTPEYLTLESLELGHIPSVSDWKDTYNIKALEYSPTHEDLIQDLGCLLDNVNEIRSRQLNL